MVSFLLEHIFWLLRFLACTTQLFISFFTLHSFYQTGHPLIVDICYLLPLCFSIFLYFIDFEYVPNFNSNSKFLLIFILQGHTKALAINANWSYTQNIYWLMKPVMISSITTVSDEFLIWSITGKEFWRGT